MKHKAAHYQGAIYHVMLRGNNKENIFFQHKDYEYFIERLQICIQKYGIKIHLFCLMTNHVHLVIEVEQIPLSKVMQSLQTSFTMTMNKRHQRCGHLSQGRFIDKLVQDEKYLLELCFYIHNNPLKANLVQNLNDYRWSSHHAYLEIMFDWVNTGLINSLLQRHAVNEHVTYLDFINDRDNAFATPRFFEIDAAGNIKVKDIINQENVLSHKTEINHLELSLIIEKTCEQFDIARDKLYSESSAAKIVMARSVIAYISHYYGVYYLKDIAYHFGRAPESFSRTTHKNIVKIQKDPTLKQILNRIIKKLSSKY